MGLFRINRELNSKFCTMASLVQVSSQESLVQVPTTLYYREENIFRRVTVSRVPGFSLAESLPGKKRIFLLPPISFFISGCCCANEVAACKLPYQEMASGKLMVLA